MSTKTVREKKIENHVYYAIRIHAKRRFVCDGE